MYISGLLSEELTTILKKENFQVTVHSFISPFHLPAPGTSPALILLDTDCISGEECETIRYLRKHPQTRQIPVIFITTVRHSVIVSECLNYPYTDFITRPVKDTELLLRIRHQLSLVKARQTIRKQNERLKATLASRNKLYSVIAHDLRAPIGTIKMINALIENDKDKIRNAGIRKKFEMINETTEEAFNLLENLLRWTRNQTGKTKVIATTFDISVTIRQVVSLFTSIAAAKNIHLLSHLKPNLVVYADEDMIKTVLRNLISNAIKFTCPGGKVEINLTCQAPEAFVSVKDTGIGIKPEDQKKILKGQQAASNYGTKNEKGSGLGLLLCQDFIKKNKGRLKLSSHPGKGSVFSFSIPLDQPQ